jgi:peptidoglycan/LPS O-acetylase OafA/YrhL
MLESRTGEGWILTGATAAVGIGGSFLAAAFSWHYFERPILALKDRFRDA